LKNFKVNFKYMLSTASVRRGRSEHKINKN
jgi:hypothetical protein